MKKIKFFSDNHHGDVFFSRPFVAQIIQNNFDKIQSFEFYSKCHEDLILDIPNLISKKFEDDEYLNNLILNYQIQDEDYLVHGDTIYVNTWAARKGLMYVGHNLCNFTFDGFYNSYLNLINNFNFKFPEKKQEFFKNDFNYSCFKQDRFEKINEIMNDLKNKNKILICNNGFFSNQSYEYDFDKLINKNMNQDSFIFLTNYSDKINKRENVFFVSDVTGGEVFESNVFWKIKDKSDLVEISYISEFCNFIIGRDSGPAEVTKNYKNITSQEKTFISLCKHDINVPWYSNNICNYNRFSNVIEFDRCVTDIIGG